MQPLKPEGTRYPVVAGSFYPAEKEALISALKSCFLSPLGPGSLPSREQISLHDEARIECFIVPHAGYEYSGPVAAHAYLKLSKLRPHTAIILGPNHNGIGSGISLSPAKEWATPLGLLPLDLDFADRLMNRSSIIDLDEQAHQYEHSIEVQLPFLQFIWKEISIVPISMMLQDSESASQVAESLIEVLHEAESLEKRYVVLGSSDLSHYENQERALEDDQRLLDPIGQLNVRRFYSNLQRHAVTACGYGPIAVTMNVARESGKERGTLLKHATSGDVSGDFDRVVGYSAVHFT